MTLKTIAVGATVVVLASLGLAIGGVFGQEAAVKPAPAPAVAAPGRKFVYQTQPGQLPGAGMNQPAPGGVVYLQTTVADPSYGVHDEEGAKLIALDAQLQQKSQTLLALYTEAGDDEQKSKVRDQLAETLEQQFSIQQSLREREVAKIEGRVKKLRETINKRSDAKRSIIDKRLDQLIREADGLGWNAPASGPAYPSGANYFQPAGGDFQPVLPVDAEPTSPDSRR